MIKRAQFPFPVPMPKPVGASQSFYWVAFSACLAASWAEARGAREERERFLEVAFEHLCMRAQAQAVGLADPVPVRGLVQDGFGTDKPS